jgi:hypothetical protein
MILCTRNSNEYLHTNGQFHILEGFSLPSHV